MPQRINEKCQTAETALLVPAAHSADLHAVDLTDPRYSVSGVGPGLQYCRGQTAP
jgi:hypothetical protein